MATKITFWIQAVLLAIATAFPPFYFSLPGGVTSYAGYHFFFDPPTTTHYSTTQVWNLVGRFDLTLLVAEWFVILAAGYLARRFLFVPRKDAISADGPPRPPQSDLPPPVKASRFSAGVDRALRIIYSATLVLCLIGAFAAAAIPEYAGRPDPKGWGSLTIWIAMSAIYLAHVRGRSKWKYFFAALLGGFVFSVASVAVIGHLNHGASRVEAEILKNSTYRALKEADPRVYADILEKFRDGVRDNQPQDEIAAKARPLILAAVRRSIPRASDASLVAYYRAQFQTAEAILKVNPPLCYDLLLGATGVPQPGIVPDDIRRREAEALADVIASAKGRQSDLPSEPPPILPEIISRLDAKYGKDVELLDMPKVAEDKKGRACEIAIAMYNEIFQLPANQAGSAIRYLSAK